MTQIVSILSIGSFVMLVEDRLVTNPRGEPFDDLANKNVIYWALDAIVCMGYTGPAYIGNLPTDSWIIAKLTGLPTYHGGVRWGPVPQLLYIGQAITLLEKELHTSEVAALKDNFELVIVGWQWNRGRARRGRLHSVPVGWLIRKPRGGTFAVTRLERYCYWPRNSKSIAVPDENMSRPEIDELWNRLRELSRDRTLPPEEHLRTHEQAIVDAIRSVSDRNRYVGKNCLSILLAPPHRRAFGRVRFFPHKHYSATDLGIENAQPQYPAAFAPWIIGHNMIMSPQAIVGDAWEMHMGPFSILVEGFGGGNVCAMTDQIRPLRPSK
jgi:hypothetical protein